LSTDVFDIRDVLMAVLELKTEITGELVEIGVATMGTKGLGLPDADLVEKMHCKIRRAEELLQFLEWAHRYEDWAGQMKTYCKVEAKFQCNMRAFHIQRRRFAQTIFALIIASLLALCGRCFGLPLDLSLGRPNCSTQSAEPIAPGSICTTDSGTQTIELTGRFEAHNTAAESGILARITKGRMYPPWRRPEFKQWLRTDQQSNVWAHVPLALGSWDRSRGHHHLATVPESICTCSQHTQTDESMQSLKLCGTPSQSQIEELAQSAEESDSDGGFVHIQSDMIESERVRLGIIRVLRPLL
jgi:hypothetical protein